MKLRYGASQIRARIGSSAAVLRHTESSLNLIPGDGFAVDWESGITAVGSPGDTNYDATAAAHWDVVPYQSVTDSPFHVSVVAFHINEIDRVDFYLNGGPAISSRIPTLNAATGVYEYWAIIDPDVLLSNGVPDGPIDVRAVAYPATAGQPRILDSLNLVSNAGGSLPQITVWCSTTGSDSTGDGTEGNPFRQPYRAIKEAESQGGATGADGCLVYLKAGTYTWGDANANFPPVTTDRWPVIMGAPGTLPSDVLFDTETNNGYKTNLVAVSGVTFDNITARTATSTTREIWFDNCTFNGNGTQRPYLDANWSGVYLTRSSGNDLSNGFIGAQLVRDCSLTLMREDVFTGSNLVVNSTASQTERLTASDAHPDFYQLYSNGGIIDNKILYGVTSTDTLAQGIFASNASLVKNVAFVNVLIARPNGDTTPLQSQFLCPMSHVVMRGVTLPNSQLLFRSLDMSIVDIWGCCFDEVAISPFNPGDLVVFDSAWFRSCHFTNASSDGTDSSDATTGDPLFTSPTKNDFRPSVGSSLLDRIVGDFIVVDVSNSLRESPHTVGAYH